MIFLSFHRPHDRVPLKEMKADWHSCLDSKVGFKVSNYTWYMEVYFCLASI